jgi:hypothetical protein
MSSILSSRKMTHFLSSLQLATVGLFLHNLVHSILNESSQMPFTMLSQLSRSEFTAWT